MRKVLFSLAAAGTAVAIAAPASAQYYQQPQQQPGYGYTNGYNNSGYSNNGYNGGYNNGYNQYGRNGYGQLRTMQSRIDGIQRQVEQLKARRMISRNEANGLRSESRNLEMRLARASRYGLNPNEARTIEYGIARLEQHVAREARDGRGRGYGYGNGNGQYGNGYNNAQGRDNDRDGRDDRYEDDHGTRHDNH